MVGTHRILLSNSGNYAIIDDEELPSMVGGTKMTVDMQLKRHV